MRFLFNLYPLAHHYKVDLSWRFKQSRFSHEDTSSIVPILPQRYIVTTSLWNGYVALKPNFYIYDYGHVWDHTYGIHQKSCTLCLLWKVQIRIAIGTDLLCSAPGYSFNSRTPILKTTSGDYFSSVLLASSNGIFNWSFP